MAAFFPAPAYRALPARDPLAGHEGDRAFAKWVGRNVRPHKTPGYASVVLSLKKTGVPPGDATADQMDFVADMADRFSFGELRVTHEQNLVLADVEVSHLYELWQLVKAQGLATPNIGLLTDIVCCPGGDFCSLANAKSLPIAEAIAQRFDDIDFQHDIGDIELNMSGCINACGHHHVGNIGVLGVDKDGSEWYQVSIGGAQGNQAALGKIIGPSFSAQQMPEVIERLLKVYLRERHEGEPFIETVNRLGIGPFKEHVYAMSFDADAGAEAQDEEAHA